MPEADSHLGPGAEIRAGAPGSSGTESLRLMFVVPFSPRRDAKHGGRVVAQLLLRLAEHHRLALVHLRGPGSRRIEDLLADRCDIVEEIQVEEITPARAKWNHRLHVLSAPLTGLPSPVSPQHESRFRRAIVDVASRWRPDVIQIEHDNIAYCGPLLRESGDRAIRVLTCHEPGTLAAEDQAGVSNGRQRFAHRLDAATWRRYWSRTLPDFDAVVTLTERDRGLIESAVTGPRFISIGLGIDIPEDTLSATGHGEANVLYIGGYRHPPNRDAALRLLNSIMPKVRRRLPGLRLLLVGTNPGAKIFRNATADDTVTGMVPDVEPLVDATRLLVLPIRLGGGQRVKLLEALAAGKAAVASPLAAAGLQVTDGTELVLAETDDEFAEAIVELIGDEAARTRLGAAAREWAVRNLSWESRVDAYEQLYGSLLAERR